MHLVLLLAALCSSCLAFPTKKPDVIHTEPTERKQTATAGEEKKCVFERLHKANKHTPTLTGKYIISHLDIVSSVSRSAKVCPQGICLWPTSSDGLVRIPYVISADYTPYEQALFEASFKDFADETCIRLVPRTSETNYLSFESLNGCWSPIGRVGGAQTVSLQRSGCMWASVIEHEIMHSLGLHHEHVRNDRDKYVSVQWNNISPGNQGNFQMTSTNNMILTKYDYESLMHYSGTAFSIDGFLPTLVAVPDPNIPLGNGFMMSDLDIMKLNTLYKCAQQKPNQISQEEIKVQDKPTLTTMARPTTTTPTATTSSPKTTITSTTTTPKTTTTTLNTSSTTTTTPTTTTTITTNTNTNLNALLSNVCGGTLSGPSGVITSPNYPNNYPKNAYCHWNITTTSQFTITFTGMDVEDIPYCIWDSVKVYNGPIINNAVLTGTYCGKNLPSPITSYKTSVQIVFASDAIVERKGFSLEYHTV